MLLLSLFLAAAAVSFRLLTLVYLLRALGAGERLLEQEDSPWADLLN